MIERETFDEFYQYFDPETVAEVIDIFEEEKEDRIGSMEKYLDEKSYTELARATHSLKGIIGNFMDPVAYQLACNLEEFALAHEEMEMKKTLSALKRACDDLVKELKEIRYSYVKSQGLTTGSS